MYLYHYRAEDNLCCKASRVIYDKVVNRAGFIAATLRRRLESNRDTATRVMEALSSNIGLFWHSVPRWQVSARIKHNVCPIAHLVAGFLTALVRINNVFLPVVLWQLNSKTPFSSLTEINFLRDFFSSGCQTTICTTATSCYKSETTF